MHMIFFFGVSHPVSTTRSGVRLIRIHTGNAHDLYLLTVHVHVSGASNRKSWQQSEYNRKSWQQLEYNSVTLF